MICFKEGLIRDETDINHPNQIMTILMITAVIKRLLKLEELTWIQTIKSKIMIKLAHLTMTLMTRATENNSVQYHC